MAAMSHLIHLTAIDRPDSRVSMALSDSTYHSFQDNDLPEPEAPSRPIENKPITVRPPPTVVDAKEEECEPMAGAMRRQDSGYESIITRETLSSQPRTSSPASFSSARQRRTRPPNRRSPKLAPVSHRPRSALHTVSPPGTSRSHSSQPQQPVSYFYFPHFTSSDPALVEPGLMADDRNPKDSTSTATYALRCDSQSHQLPPQTTHYWTSDRTRRLEYAAIDAASKGVRGWVMRHVVPDCFVPQSKRRVGFEDDRGSVVRYRLDLDTDEGMEKPQSIREGGWKGWLFSSRRR